MPAKPRRYPKEDNFHRLPDDKATRRLIDAMLDMRDPVPWNERPVPAALPPLAKLARRIELEADAGRNVRLKPETARKVALALYTVADGPMPWGGLKSYGHRVVQYSSSDAGEVLAYCRGVDLAIGAIRGGVCQASGGTACGAVGRLYAAQELLGLATIQIPPKFSPIMTDQKNQALPHFHYGLPDIYDGAPWSEMAIADLRAAVQSGSTPKEAAGHLCRSGTVDDVKRKAEELGLKWQAPSRISD
jgi:hypothetical protein